jgi:uncharacterized membrane protein YkoI
MFKLIVCDISEDSTSIFSNQLLTRGAERSNHIFHKGTTMNKFLLVALILSLTALGYLAFKNKAYTHHGTRPAITDSANHNNQMNGCIKLALEKHPGAILETSVEMEDGQLISDVDIQGDDGKKWEVECVLATNKLIEDKQEN